MIRERADTAAVLARPLFMSVSASVLACMRPTLLMTPFSAPAIVYCGNISVSAISTPRTFGYQVSDNTGQGGSLRPHQARALFSPLQGDFAAPLADFPTFSHLRQHRLDHSCLLAGVSCVGFVFEVSSRPLSDPLLCSTGATLSATLEGKEIELQKSSMSGGCS